jgi:hypothetical protein
MKLINWFNKKMAIIGLAMSKVEKNAFSQSGGELTNNMSQEQRHTKGTAIDDLKQGIITQEVKNLRWRTYKILGETQGRIAEIIGYDDDGMPIVKTRKTDNKSGLRKVKIEPSDKYPIEMVVDNSEIPTSGNDTINNEYLDLLDKPQIVYDENGEAISATHGEIDANEFFITNKSELPINIERDEAPKFKIENFTKKLHIRKISESKRLLEFYVSMYPDEFIRTTRLFISEVKKAIDNPNQSTMLSINNVDFVSYKTIGVNDFLMFKYNNLKFDKIATFNGHYVIKFIGDVEINGESIFDEYRVDELDNKYENKDKK